MKKIPYGISDYNSIRTENYYYVDKTEFIVKLEKLSTKYPVFLRPRRFGKSLLVSTLQYYYDILEKDNFDELFHDTYIGTHKTTLANSYYVLRLDFSALDTTSLDELKESFSNKVKQAIHNFMSRYGFTYEIDDSLPIVAFTESFLLQLNRSIGKKLYILIDEYDHFANELLTNKSMFYKITGKDGFVRSFYEVLKSHSGNGCLDKLFITGVTSLTLDSLTSGFNIAENISTEPAFNELLGFTYEETKILAKEMQVQPLESTMLLLKEHYNGYLFSEDAYEKVFNSNMVLYFMNKYVSRNKIPNTLTDPNIISDYRKLTAMFNLYDDVAQKESILRDMMLNNSITTRIVSSFTLSTRFDKDHFLSLLYYLGLLTIESLAGNGSFRLKMPNKVIASVYYDYFYTYLQDTFSIGTYQVEEALEAMQNEKDLNLFIKIIESILIASSSQNNRIFIHFRESTLQMLFYIYLRKSMEYKVVPEYKVTNGYIDIALLPYSEKFTVNHYYIMEFKYISKTKYEKEAEILDEYILQAKNQLDNYAKDETLLNIPNLRKYPIVFIENRCVYCEELE